MLECAYGVQTSSRYFPDCGSVVLAPVVERCEVHCCGRRAFPVPFCPHGTALQAVSSITGGFAAVSSGSWWAGMVMKDAEVSSLRLSGCSHTITHTYIFMHIYNYISAYVSMCKYIYIYSFQICLYCVLEELSKPFVTSQQACKARQL